MNKGMPVGLVLAACVAVGQVGISPQASAQDAKGLRVVSDRTVSGFAFPESVAYDPKAKVLYMGQFGSELKPAEKDGKGRISKVSLDGKVLEDRFLPAQGETLHKPKGIWVRGERLWVTDIDVVWIFDLKSRKGRKLDLPGMGFANDVAVQGDALYISDNRGRHALPGGAGGLPEPSRQSADRRGLRGQVDQPQWTLPGARWVAPDGRLPVPETGSRHLLCEQEWRNQDPFEGDRRAGRRL